MYYGISVFIILFLVMFKKFFLNFLGVTGLVIIEYPPCSKLIPLSFYFREFGSLVLERKWYIGNASSLKSISLAALVHLDVWNSKFIENKDTHSVDTVVFAIRGEESFQIANAWEEALGNESSGSYEIHAHRNSKQVICKFDGSWSSTSSLSGHGWLAFSHGHVVHLGLRGLC